MRHYIMKTMRSLQGPLPTRSSICQYLYRIAFQRDGPVTRLALVMFGALAGSLIGLLGTATQGLSAMLLGLFTALILILLCVGLDGHYWIVRTWHLNTRCGLLLSRHLLTLCLRALIGSWATAILLRSCIAKHSRQWFLKPPRIAVMADLGWDSSNPGRISTYTDVAPDQWQEAISQCLNRHSMDVAVELATAQSEIDLHKYLLVLNPYGGVYPEYDLEKHSTFGAILEYARAGGIFANVCDVPLFWAYSPSERRPMRCVGSVSYGELADGTRRMSTPLLDRLQVPMYALMKDRYDWDLEFADKYGISLDPSLTVKVDRVMVVERITSTGKESIAEPVVSEKTNVVSAKDLQTSPFCRVTYGIGEFIVVTPALLDMDDDSRCRLRDAIADVIVSAIAERLPGSNEAP